jgi:hypothetical protein
MSLYEYCRRNLRMHSLDHLDFHLYINDPGRLCFKDLLVASGYCSTTSVKVFVQCGVSFYRSAEKLTVLVVMLAS